MRRLLLLAALAVAAHGCGRCGRTGPGLDLARVLPREAEVIAVVPDLGALGDGLTRLQQLKAASFAAQLRGATSAGDFVAAAMFQLGVDLRSRESMAQAGVAPARGAAAVSLRGGVQYAVVAVDDEAAFHKTVERLARDRLGAQVQSQSEAAGLRITSFSRQAGGPPELSVAFKDRFAYVAAGEAGARLGAFASVEEGASLATDPDYRLRLGQLPADRQVLVRIPPASSLSRRSGSRGALLSLHIGPQALTAAVAAGLIGALESSELLRLAPEPADLLSLSAPDAFLVARTLGAPGALAPLWPYIVGPLVERAVKETGFDVQKELLENLRPGSVLSLSLAPNVNLSTGLPQLDVRRTNPFGYVHLVVAGAAKDSVRAEQTLLKLPPVAQRFGALMTPGTRAGQRVFATRYSQGEGVHLALLGDRALLAAPMFRLDDVLARASKKTEAQGMAADPALRPLLDGKPLAVAIDVHRLADSVRALPSSSWGIGGFAMKATALRWLEAVDDLGTVSLWAAAPDGALQAQLQLRFLPPGPPK